MTKRWGVGAAVSAAILSAILSTGCTGGQEGTAAEEDAPRKNGVGGAQSANVDARKELQTISKTIPVYAGAQYREDLTRRDTVMIRSQYGPGAEVYTLATDDSYPQVYHYYLTYLAQFRAFPATTPYPSERQNWRTLEVQLNQAMQDPFFPGETMRPDGRQVILQLAETEAEPKTVIRYIVAPPPQPGQAVAATAEPIRGGRTANDGAPANSPSSSPGEADPAAADP